MKESIFKGLCPHCKNNVEFYLPTIFQTLFYMIKIITLSPFKDIPSSYQLSFNELGRIGRCSHCNKNVLKCPYCGHINNSHYDYVICEKCEKEIYHP